MPNMKTGLHGCRRRLTGSLPCPSGTLEQVTSALLELLRWERLCVLGLGQMSAPQQ